MKNTCIIYNAGAYGTFIEWVLTEFVKEDYTLPFTSKGNAHNFVGNFLYRYYDANGNTLSADPLPIMEKLHEYVHSLINHDVVRFHSMGSIPDTDQFDNIIDYVNQNFKKIIVMHPSWDSFLWSMNNAEYNVNDSIRSVAHKKHYSPFLTKWGVERIEDAENWQMREFFSLYKYEQFLSETQIQRIAEIKESYPDVHFLCIDSLKDNFTRTIVDLLEYCEMKPVGLEKIKALGDSWIDKQIYKDRDQVVKRIVSAVLNNEYYNWDQENLTLIDEAMIQYYLRQKDLSIRCYNLNTFPTNTEKLRTYIDYPT